MSRPLPIHQLQTPAGLYGLTQSETPYGGQIGSLAFITTVWGDFQPRPPATQSTSDGDAYVLQQAEFLCRSAQDMRPGSVLRIGAFDWTVLSLDEAADGHVRLRIERAHA